MTDIELAYYVVMKSHGAIWMIIILYFNYMNLKDLELKSVSSSVKD